MSKRVQFNEDANRDIPPEKISKNTLDSDEEYEPEPVGRLREEDIEGEEGATLEYDNETKITPFNMKEELDEDGHFDASGNFIFSKKKEPTDNWLEEINWLDVKKAQDTGKYKDVPQVTEEATEISVAEQIVLYENMLPLLNDKENVLRAIKRMSACNDPKKSSSASQRWLKKKTVKTEANPSSGNPEGLLKLTELADRLLQSGDFDIYNKSKEQLIQLISVSKQNEEDDELEAFGKQLDNGDEQNNDSDANKQQDESAGNNAMDAEEMWEMKKSSGEDAKIEGPYSTSQMIAWLNEGKFSAQELVLVRRTKLDNSPFYNIKRIDFELYA